MENPKILMNALALLTCTTCLLIPGILADSHFEVGRQDWTNHGGDIYNRRYAEDELKISPETVSKLRLKWKFSANNDITATPAIYQGTLYFPSWDGYLYAIKSSDGSLVWKQYLQNLTGLNPIPRNDVNWTVSRSTPTIAGNLLIVGIYGPCYVIAVKRLTGELVWSTQLDGHPAGLVTMSGTVYKGGFYVGTSSIENFVSSIEDCCTFRGSFTKLDIQTGRILWRTFTLPNNNGRKGQYAGAAIWGSSPPIDTYRNHVYIATGNLYSVPLSVQECQEKQNNQTVPTHPDFCIAPYVHSESILAIDLDSGHIKWSQQLGGYDVWLFACTNLSTPNCPPGPNRDADFGEAPMMLRICVNGSEQDVVVATQKSGFAWTLNRDNGSIVWSTEAGPGGLLGGGTWGSATDTKTIYTNIANSESLNFTLKPTTKTTNSGGWVAMNANTGHVLWSTANPKNASSPGPVSVANGVLFAGSAHPTGPFYALNAKTGQILWNHDTGATVYGGASVSDGCIYFGNGYFPILSPKFTPGNSLFAYCVCV